MVSSIFVADFLERPDVSIRSPGPSIESTESTNYVADVCVVNIAVDDVGDDVVGVSSLANFVGGHTDSRDIVRFEQTRCNRQTSAARPPGPCPKYSVSHSACIRSLLLSSTISKMGRRRANPTHHSNHTYDICGSFMSFVDRER